MSVRPGSNGILVEHRAVSILLVDHVLPLVEIEKNYLKRTTCRVLTARTGAQAIGLCRQDPPDLVFLDAAMPEMDGIAACRLLKADTLLSRIPIVIVTSEDRVEECRGAGCDDILIKPFDAGEFLDAVRRFVPVPERLDNRIPVSCRVEFKSQTGSYKAYTRDLSSRGLFLKSSRPFAIGIRLQMVLHLPGRRGERPSKGESLEILGEVRRVMRPTPGSHLLAGIGIRFVDPSPEVLRAIDHFIAARLGR